MEKHLHLLRAGLGPDSTLRDEALPSDVRTVIIGEEHHQLWSSCLDQEDPEPPYIKEEPEEPWTSQGGEQLQALEEAGVTKFPFSLVPVKREDEKPQPSQLHQSLTEDSKDSVRGSHTDLEPGPDGSASESDTEVSDWDWGETTEPRSGLGCVKTTESVVDLNFDAVERMFSCSECGQRFGRKPHLNAHMRIHTGEKPFSCLICGKRFSQKGNSISHMRLHTGEKPFSCSVCKKHFRYSGDVSRHMRIHTGTKKNSCSHMIGTGPEPARNLDPETPLVKGTEDKPAKLETEVTDDVWKETSEPLSDYLQSSTDKDSFRCSECGKTFCRKDHLMNHTRTHTGEKPFSCSVCQKRFSCSGNILAHMRIHTGEKPFVCSFCGKGFSQKGTLQLHMRIHTGEKPFSCPFCDKSFAHKRRMTLHMSVHTEEKRFVCTVCGRRFTWYTQLKTHKCIGETSQLQNPTGKKVLAKESFSCSECGKTFSLKGNLKTHMRIHTGEKPFSCSVCRKSFKQNVHLTEHMTIHTGQKLYTCSICGKGFNKKLLVRNHLCLSPV